MGQCFSSELEEDRYSPVYKYRPYDWLSENRKEQPVENKPIERVGTNIAIAISANQSEDRNIVLFSAKAHETNSSINNIQISINMGQCTSAQARGRSNSIEEAPYTLAKRDKANRYRGRYEPIEWDIYVDEKVYNRPRNRARSFNSLRWDTYAEPERERSNSEVIPRKKKREPSPEEITEDRLRDDDTAIKTAQPNGFIPKSKENNQDEGRPKEGIETQFSGEFYPEESPIVAKNREPTRYNPRRNSLEEPRRRRLSETVEPDHIVIPLKNEVPRESTVERERRQGKPQQIVVRKVEPPEQPTNEVYEPFRRRDVENKPVVGISPSDKKGPEAERKHNDQREIPVRNVYEEDENTPRKTTNDLDERPKQLAGQDSWERTLRKSIEANNETMDSDSDSDSDSNAESDSDDEDEIMDEAEKRDAPPDYKEVVPNTTSVITYRNSPVTVHTIMSDKNRNTHKDDAKNKDTDKDKSDDHELPKYSNLPLSSTTEPIDKPENKDRRRSKPALFGKAKHSNGPISADDKESEKPTHESKGTGDIQPKTHDKPLYSNVPVSVNDKPKVGDSSKHDTNPIYSNGPLTEQKDKPKDSKVETVPKSDEQKKPTNSVVTPRMVNGNGPKLNGIINFFKPSVKRDTKEKDPDISSDLKSPKSPRQSSCDNLGTRPEKEAVKETVLIPNKFPQLFTGKRHAWRGLLLFGPAGSGKASLATAVAKEIGHSYSTLQSFITFNSFNGNAISAMFKKARENTPHVIIIDQLDGLSAAELRELHKQMTLTTAEQFEGLLVVGITDAPWLLDKYIVELFEKRIFITLPSAASRAELFRENLEQSQHSLTEEDFIELGAWSEGYTCADIISVVNETLMRSMRKIQHATYFKKVSTQDPVTSHPIDMYTPCSPGEEGAIEMDWTRVPEKKLQEPVIRLSDVLVALRTQKPSLNPDDVEKHKQFAKKFTQHGSNNNSTQI